MTPRSAGLLLIGASAAGLALANSPAADGWQTILTLPVLGHGLQHWVNDALMTLFFLLVGCEIKRELMAGNLATAADRWLPGLAAVGGMLVPALVYASINLGAAGRPDGWAIPAATDIAFALGVLALLGPRVPKAAALLLTTIAVLDDMGAVIVIALFYAKGLNLLGLAAMALVMAVLYGLNRRGVTRAAVYLPLGLLLWVATEYAGLHATIAGVLLAITLPLPLAARVEQRLHTLCAAFIVPLFGLVNAGVSLTDLDADALRQPVTLGIALGLVLGKPAGILIGCAIALRLGLARLPAGLDRRTLLGLSCLCGIGFTMSLFIGLLAFPGDAAMVAAMKLGVLLGSLVSALLGVAVIRGRKSEIRSR